MAKILLVEDDKSLREIYGVRLQAEGYEIVSAGDGEEALALAIKERPDLIVSDVMMPKISGFDMLDILRSTTETKDVKVIMMTALSSDDQRARGESLGADRYLVKSQVGIEDVVRTVHEVLGDNGAIAVQAAPAPIAEPSMPATPVEPVAPPVISLPETPASPVVPEDPSANTVQELSDAASFDTEPTTLTQAPVAPEAPVVERSPQVSTIKAFDAPPYEPTSAVNTPAPVTPTPMVNATTPAPAPVIPQPSAPIINAAPSATPLPQPTAPFSSPAPASLGTQVRDASSVTASDPSPSTPPTPAPIQATPGVAMPLDLSAQMAAELGATSVSQQVPTPAPTVDPTPPAAPVVNDPALTSDEAPQTSGQVTPQA